jgi:ubiquinone/menaquinone biosynthesis C-methylase UbiE
MGNIEALQEYWDRYTRDIQSQFTDKEFGSKEYFQEIKKYHDNSYELSNKILNLPALKGKSVLEIGCGIGLDALEYAKSGAKVTAIDISPVCIGLAKKYFAYNNLHAQIEIGNVEELYYSDNSFDVVIARQILMFIPNTQKAIEEILRVLKSGGEIVALLHNKYSWYVFLGKISGTKLVAETKDPPINKFFSIREVKYLFEGFSNIEIVMDKFPTKTNRRSGIFAMLYNNFFVNLTKAIPKKLMKPFGYYIIVKAIKTENQ